jgi:hypothetical protein
MTQYLFRPGALVITATCLSFAAIQMLDAQAVRDSAGIQIVENSSPRLPSNRAWRLSEASTLDIGASGGATEYEFQNTLGAESMFRC